MVLIGLLLVALVCLALGLVLASAGWLIGSLAASAAAAWVLWRGRDRIVASPASGEAETKQAPLTVGAVSRGSGATTGGSQPATPSQASADVVPETSADADYARRRADELAGLVSPPPAVARSAVVVPAVPAAAAQPLSVDPDVWVIDGRPNYHTAHCGVLLGADSEAIARSQAVEDGFTPCTLCDPDAHPEQAASSATTGAGNAAGAATEPAANLPDTDVADGVHPVYVVDGWPHYHEQGCAQLAGADAEAIPFGQAADDGFTPCPTCRPAVVEPAAVEPAAVDPDAVVPEEPTVAAEPVLAEPVAVEPEPIAVAPEPVMEPAPEPTTQSETVPAAGSHGGVWVVAGRPRFHVQGCMILGDQDAFAVPYEQAVDDGFKPCSLCEPS